MPASQHGPEKTNESHNVVVHNCVFQAVGSPFTNKYHSPALTPAVSLYFSYFGLIAFCVERNERNLWPFGVVAGAGTDSLQGPGR